MHVLFGKWVQPAHLLEAEHQLCWSQHGGSGYSYTRADFLDMTVREIADRTDRARVARAQMSKAMKKAQKAAKS